jgi:HEPN domain-containing protein
MTVNEWVSKAEQDYKAIQQLLNVADEPLWDVIGFHAQQGAEKYFKAYLLKQSNRVPKTHDLETLLHACLTMTDEWHSLNDYDMNLLTMGAVESRYPGVSLNRPLCEDMLVIAYAVRCQSRIILGIEGSA